MVRKRTRSDLESTLAPRSNASTASASRATTGFPDRPEPEEVIEAPRVQQAETGQHGCGEDRADHNAPHADQRPEHQDRRQPEELRRQRRSEGLVHAPDRVDTRVVAANRQVESEPQEEDGDEGVGDVEPAVNRPPDRPAGPGDHEHAREPECERQPPGDRGLDAVRLAGAMQVAHLGAQCLERTPPEARHEGADRRGHDDEPEVPPREVPEEEEHRHRMQRGLIEVAEEEIAKPVERVAPEPITEDPFLEHDDTLLARRLPPEPAVKRSLGHRSAYAHARARVLARVRRGRRLRAATTETSPQSCRSFRYGISRNARASRRPVRAFMTMRAIQ